MNKGLFLDRDGVVNTDFKYVHTIKKFVFRPEIFKITKAAVEKQFKIIIITNQGGIGRGLYTQEQFYELNQYMINKFMSKGIKINKVYFCPFHPTHGKGYYRRESYNRKPNPGMIIKACQEYMINPRYSVMIGDQITDQKAAKSALIARYIDAKDRDWVTHSLTALNF